MIRRSVFGHRPLVVSSALRYSLTRPLLLSNHHRQLSSSSPILNQSQGVVGNGKICSVPFAFGEHAARERTYVAALLASAQLSNLVYATAYRFLGSWATSLLREFGLGNNLHHQTTRAALLPIWRWQMQAEIRARPSDSGQGQAGRESGLQAFLHDGYLPGNAYSPLSLLPFATQTLPEDTPTYDPSQALSQLGAGNSIVPIDFTVSPLEALEEVKRRLGRIVFWEGLKIDLERDVEIKRLAAYPIYFPVYISEYTFTPEERGKSRSITIVMDAHEADADSCRLAVPRPFNPRQATINSSQDAAPNPSETYWVNVPAFLNNIAIHTDSLFLPTAANGANPQVSLASSLAESYAQWLNPPARPPTSAEVEEDPRLAHYTPSPSPLARIDQVPIDWSDPRIMAWNGSDREQMERKLQDDQLALVTKMQQEAAQEMYNSVQKVSSMAPESSSAASPPKRPLRSGSRGARSSPQSRRYTTSARRDAAAPSSSSAVDIKPPTTTTTTATALERFPAAWRPYLELMRLDKPIGTVLLYWPCAWAITLASTLTHQPLWVPFWYLTLFGIGAIIMRGAGCTINDMWDQKIDRQVDRTKQRPLARGAVTPLQALTFLGFQLSAGLAVLTQLNMYSILLGASSLSLVVVYPLMKRITYYPQFVLGLAFNWGALLGWSAVAGQVDWTIATPLYAAGISWCMLYDTIYAHQDKADDIQVGVRSTALRFGNSSRAVLSGFATTTVSLLTYVGYLAQATPLYFVVSCAGSAAHFAWQLATVNFDSRKECWSKFIANGYTGGLIWLGTMVDYAVRAWDVQWLMW